MCRASLALQRTGLAPGSRRTSEVARAPPRPLPLFWASDLPRSLAAPCTPCFGTPFLIGLTPPKSCPTAPASHLLRSWFPPTKPRAPYPSDPWCTLPLASPLSPAPLLQLLWQWTSPFLSLLPAHHALLMATSPSGLLPLGLTTQILSLEIASLSGTILCLHTPFPKLPLSVPGAWASFVNPALP